MAKLSFETVKFKEKQGAVRAILLNHSYFEVKKEELEKIGDFLLQEGKLIFPKAVQELTEKKFDLIFAKGIHELKSLNTENKVIYIHQNSGIPLVGSVSFGIVYRNTTLIEIKPTTGCNLNCIYCSVGEGKYSHKTDFLVEKDYLVEELEKLIRFVGRPIEAHIGTHGEPFLYGDIVPLIADLDRNPRIHTVSIDTNGSLLNKELIERLAPFRKLRLNVSLNTLDKETARKMSGVSWHDVGLIVKNILSAKKEGIRILLTPLIIPGYNDTQLEELVKFAKENDLSLGIQNFLYYKTGRNPARPWPWETFYGMLNGLEKRYGLKLILSPADFGIEYASKLEKPFRKDEEIMAVVACPDRFPDSRIAVAKGRTISVPNCTAPINKKIRIKLIRDKHNIFVGKAV